MLTLNYEANKIVYITSSSIHYTFLNNSLFQKKNENPNKFNLVLFIYKT